MPEAPSIFKAGQLPYDADYDIMDEYNTILDGALDMRRKLSSLSRQARQWQTELLAKQAEIDRLTARHQRELSDHQKIFKITRSKLQTQGNRLQQYREANRSLRLRNRELTGDLETVRRDLDNVEHLRCNICMVSFKKVVTVCGHGFCRECLHVWLRQPLDTYNGGGPGNRCPMCRQTVKESDIRGIYLEHDSRISAAPEDDRATEILSVDSDSE